MKILNAAAHHIGVWIQAMAARQTAITALNTERDSKEHQEAVVKANANVWQSTLECVHIVNMKIVMGYFDELT